MSTPTASRWAPRRRSPSESTVCSRPFDDEGLREQWLPGGDLRLRTATAPKSARYDWEDGSTRVNVGFTDKGDAKSTVELSHERLPDADTADEMKTWWRGRLTALKSQLEGGEVDA